MKIHQRAIVKQVCKGGIFLCYLQDNEDHKVKAHLCGNMRMNRIGLCIGDEITVELSPYDLSRGRVIWRQPAQ